MLVYVGVVRDLWVAAASAPPLDTRSWLGRPWVETVTVESRPKIEELLREATKGPTRWRQVNYAAAPGGPDVPVVFSAIRVNATGRVLAVGRDLRTIAALQQRLVEAQQSMERDYSRLRSAETRYRLLFQVTAEAVLVVDAQTHAIVDANPAASQLLGLPLAELVGRTFPVGIDPAHAAAVANLLSAARAAGRADEILVNGLAREQRFVVSASLFRQESGVHFLVRLAPHSSADPARGFAAKASRLAEVIDAISDGFVVTDAEGAVLTANRAFLEIAQVPTEAQAKGKSLARWLGRPGVDLNVLLANLRQHGSVRLFATRLRGELGAETDVEISAVVAHEGNEPCFGLMVRDVGRRLAKPDQVIGERVPRSVEDLAELIGQVPLKEIVRQTTDLIERLCIEAALTMTEDNRASAAEMLGLSRQGFYTKLRRYGLGDLESLEE
jgi:transcriptional regulator PpsR